MIASILKKRERKKGGEREREKERKRKREKLIPIFTFFYALDRI